jgi:hypothetical protein
MATPHETGDLAFHLRSRRPVALLSPRVRLTPALGRQVRRSAAAGLEPLAASREDLEWWQRILEEAGRSPATGALRLAAVSGLYATALDVGLVDRNPADRVRRPKLCEDWPRAGLTDANLNSRTANSTLTRGRSADQGKTKRRRRPSHQGHLDQGVVGRAEHRAVGPAPEADHDLVGAEGDVAGGGDEAAPDGVWGGRRSRSRSGGDGECRKWPGPRPSGWCRGRR